MFITPLSYLASSSLAQALVRKVDPGVKPNWGFFPFMTTLKQAAGGIIAVVLTVMVVILIGGAVMMAASKMSGGRGMSEKGASILLWAMVTAVIIGSASGIIAWLAAIDIGF